nr:MAG: major capsid protein [Microvirus sp.]
MHRNQSVSAHSFAMVPRADIPRSRFNVQTSHKTTFDAGKLVPIYVDEVLPGDTFSLSCTAFGRMATPIFPIMDNLHMDTFFFFVPYRLVWNNWKRFMGEQRNPGDSTSFLVPQVQTPVAGWPIGSIGDYFGLPTVGQVSAGKSVTHSALPFRAYNLIFNEWFRDENLVPSVLVNIDDGPDSSANYAILNRGKRHDYFTSCLPWPQKGPSVNLPLGTQAPVKIVTGSAGGRMVNSAGSPIAPGTLSTVAGGYFASSGSPGVSIGYDPTGTLYTDLSAATAATINAIRTAFQVQKLLERDARGGTRYTEIIRSHFGVVSPDSRLQRPEYLGGSSVPVNIAPVAQTSASSISGSATPQGNLSAIGTLLSKSGFTQSFTEHGIIIGLANIRADLNYQQGMRRMWSRRTRYDFYFPAFANLGEQAVLSKEIYCTGDPADEDVFGYQERWAEYRYHPALITGRFRSTAASTLDSWHLAQKFSSRPLLNGAFINEDPPISRVSAVNTSLTNQFIFDSFFNIKMARPMPMYSVPGSVDHF